MLFVSWHFAVSFAVVIRGIVTWHGRITGLSFHWLSPSWRTRGLGMVYGLSVMSFIPQLGLLYNGTVGIPEIAQSIFTLFTLTLNRSVDSGVAYLGHVSWGFFLTVGVRGCSVGYIYVAISVLWFLLCIALIYYRSLTPFFLGVFTRWSRRGEYHCMLSETSPMNPSSPHSQMGIKGGFVLL